ncbi:MAG: ATP-grasp domain-containing protein [Bacteroidia bacterium]|nr:ATP-grasp domain-containing protein [Bacteroidia bacterium]
MTFLCIASYFKGEEFLRACKASGATVLLITSKRLESQAWPRESIDEIFYMEETEPHQWNVDHMIAGVAWLMRSRRVDRIVALDDFDVEKGTVLREQFRIPGMGQTTGRYFRDKLAMRMRAQDAGIAVPSFAPLFTDEDISAYFRWNSGPWVIKPRSEASATGIRKVHSPEEAWEVLNSLGDRRHHFLIEQYKPGDVYHADALSVEGKIVFCQVSRYMSPPFDVAHGGGIFRSHTLLPDSPENHEIQELVRQVMQSFSMRSSASHTEFIRSREDGRMYFLETSSRVGGAHLADMVEAATGINLWREWARLEVALAEGRSYQLPAVQPAQAGIIISLARQPEPDTSAFGDPEIWWRMSREHHIGFIVRSGSQERVVELLDAYAHRVQADFHASAPAPDKPSA